MKFSTHSKQKQKRKHVNCNYIRAKQNPFLKQIKMKNLTNRNNCRRATDFFLFTFNFTLNTQEERKRRLNSKKKYTRKANQEEVTF